MAADQADILREEAGSPHAVFHQFVLLLGKCSPDCHFLFFEGLEDPAFYIGYVLARLDGREYHEFVCNGRQGVIKVNELCGRDGRAFDRTLHFIDKDHCDLMSPEEVLPSRMFQTDCYSFENYLVCQQSFRRFWTERLHLSSDDTRYLSYHALFEKLHQSFSERMKFLMAIVLIGRGIESRPVAKLNLNNVNLEKVLSINLGSGKVRWLSSGGKTFLAASNMTVSGIIVRGDAIRSVLRKYLRDRDSKLYVRGKYELWFYVKFLSLITRELSDRTRAKSAGLPRATPGDVITHTSAIDSLCGLAPRLATLEQFLEANIVPRQQRESSVTANAN
jgi:Protein of unknown function (DUF4435)